MNSLARSPQAPAPPSFYKNHRGNMTNAFTVPDKLYNVEIRECNIATNTVVHKYEITVVAETSVEAFQKGMQHCLLMMEGEDRIIYFPKSVKLAD